MNFKLKEFFHELKHHAPFTALATILAVLISILIIYDLKQNISEEIFHILHPLHVIVSAIVTSAIFYKYKKNIFQAVLVGIFGSIIIGSISDIIFPYIGGKILTLKISFHLPIIEKPLLILLSAFIGSFLGIITRFTKIPHLIHVGLSVFASIFYLLSFTENFSFLFFVEVFVIVFIAVIIPCCTSDILFPFFFLGKRIKTRECK